MTDFIYQPFGSYVRKLASGEWHLWQVPLSSGDPAKLEERERLRYRRMTHPEARNDFAASRAGLREVLARYLDCPADRVALKRGERGKPFLSGGPEFNLSHSGGVVMLAVAADPVGLDVEREDRKVQFAGLAAKFFSDSEQARIASAPAAARNRLFLRHWVCKEAAVKLSGEGIFRGLRDVEVDMAPSGPAFGRYRGRRVFFQEFSPASGFLAALASWRPVRLGGTFRL